MQIASKTVRRRGSKRTCWCSLQLACWRTGGQRRRVGWARRSVVASSWTWLREWRSRVVIEEEEEEEEEEEARREQRSRKDVNGG